MSNLHLLSSLGFKAGAAVAGIKSTPVPDIGLLVCDVPASAAAVFTTNRVVSAQVKIGRKHVAGGKLRGVVMNSGNANACTGRQGEIDGMKMCSLTGSLVGCEAKLILPGSTGIIGHTLPMEKVTRGIEMAYRNLGNSPEHSASFAQAIMTTDLRAKSAAASFKIGKSIVTIAGVCKGSGMIGPRLGLHATMLAYLTTDAKISPALLRKLLADSAERSFNAVTVDDQTSTNDTAAILASGFGAAIDSAKSIAAFAKTLDEVCQSLAYQIAADGEGATKVVRIDVRGAKSDLEAKNIARSIANSPLVKCAMNGNDPNWGRIICAAGFSGAAFDGDKATLKLQGVTVFQNGEAAKFDAEAVSKLLAVPEVVVDLNCRLGKSQATIWTCDLSKEYVTINADYHT